MSIFSIVKNPKDWLAKQFIAGLSKDVAEGKYGEKPKRVWWWVHDHALWVGAAIEIGDFVLVKLHDVGVCEACLDYDAMLVKAGLWLMSLGFALNIHAAAAPVKPKPLAPVPEPSKAA